MGFLFIQILLPVLMLLICCFTMQEGKKRGVMRQLYILQANKKHNQKHTPKLEIKNDLKILQMLLCK